MELGTPKKNEGEKLQTESVRAVTIYLINAYCFPTVCASAFGAIFLLILSLFAQGDGAIKCRVAAFVIFSVGMMFAVGQAIFVILKVRRGARQIRLSHSKRQ